VSNVLDSVLADLRLEGEQLEALLLGRPDEDWLIATPAAGWDVAAQISHLAWTDEAAVAAATDPERWDGLVAAALADIDGFVDRSALAGAAVSPDVLMDRWRESRRALSAALRAVPPGKKLPWFGPPMSPTSMATARFMETWAHSLDVHDALDLVIDPTDRIRHVAHLGVRTRGFAYLAHGEQPPELEIRVELTAPSGELWVYGDHSAGQSVRGSAYDFCRLVTQRIHRSDTDLIALGADAEHWLGIAQAFAGPPGEGRPPRSEKPHG
jgi:uncharacterized protein (TIGR03084 family)